MGEGGTRFGYILALRVRIHSDGLEALLEDFNIIVD
jgi:hypothetical protein